MRLDELSLEDVDWLLELDDAELPPELDELRTLDEPLLDGDEPAELEDGGFEDELLRPDEPPELDGELLMFDDSELDGGGDDELLTVEELLLDGEELLEADDVELL